jgi:hypothetical protein
MFALPKIRDARVAAVLWVALVTIGVAGRLWQPAWNVTPMAGIALVAGATFANPLLAASAPLATLAIGNLWLPGYGDAILGVVVYAATVWPVLLGPLVRKGRLFALCGGALAHSVVFFLTTNLACWVLFEGYPKTAAGLGACFVAALPFYRWMPVGDLAWTVSIAAGVSLAVRALRLEEDMQRAVVGGNSESLAARS